MLYYDLEVKESIILFLPQKQTKSTSKMNPRLYLAGPEVFLPNAKEYAEWQRALCHKYDFEPLHPMDNNLDLGEMDYSTAIRIYKGDVGQVRKCDIVVANCNPFRSVCVIDDGTAYELGFGNALCKPSYGYIKKMECLVTRTIRDYPTELNTVLDLYVDNEGYVVTDAFETSINLMMQCGMTETGGRLIEGDFEDCLRAIREDILSGALSFPK